MLCYFLLHCTVPEKKSPVIWIDSVLWFFLCHLVLEVYLWSVLAWVSLEFSSLGLSQVPELVGLLFLQILKFFSLYFFDQFFNLIVSSSLGLQWYRCWIFCCCPTRPWRPPHLHPPPPPPLPLSLLLPFSFSVLFTLWSSDWLNSVDMSSSPLILPSLIATLLSNPFSELFYFCHSVFQLCNFHLFLFL